MKLIVFPRILVGLTSLLASHQLARAQVFFITEPTYPMRAASHHASGDGEVLVRFERAWAEPSKVLMIKSTGWKLLDDAMVDEARYWMVLDFTAEERRDPAAMDKKLAPIVGDPELRKSMVAKFAATKPKPIKFPIEKTVPLHFRIGRKWEN